MTISTSASLKFVFRFPALLFLIFFIVSTSSARQHQPGIDWKTLKTPHFSVHFPKEFEETARHIAAICEDVYEPVSRSLNYRPGRTHVVVHTRTDVPNGFVTSIPWRMELFLSEFQNNILGSRDSWLRVLITHEFTHIVQNRKSAGLTNLSKYFLGEFNTLMTRMAPAWYIEGFATYNETRFTSGGRGRNAGNAMRLLAPLQANNAWKLDNSNYTSRKRQPIDMQYVTGYHLSDYITEKYGEDAWRRIVDRFTKFPLFGFGFAVKQVTGKDDGEIYLEMLADYRSKMNETNFSPPDQSWKFDAQPALQENPRWLNDDAIVYSEASLYDEPPGLWQVTRDGKRKRFLNHRVFQSSNGFDVGENLIVWARLSPHKRFSATQYSDLYLKNRADGREKRLTHNARVFSPSLSPDEQKIAVIQSTATGNRLAVVSVEDGSVESFWEEPGRLFFNPRWSNDGKRIAVAVKESNNSQDIYIFDAATQKAEPLYTSDAHHENTPTWSNDDRFVFFESDRSGKFNIWACEAESGKMWMVTNHAAGVFSPVVSPNGDELAVSQYTDQGLGIASYRLNPANWIPEDQTGYFSEVQLEHENEHSYGAPSQEKWRVSPYRAVKQFWRPQGWLPFVVEDEEGYAAGFFAASADALGLVDWSGILTFSTETFKPTWDFNLNFRRLFPEFTIRSYSEPEELGPVDLSEQGLGIVQSWLRRNGLEFTAGAPLLLNSDVHTTVLRPTIGFRAENWGVFPDQLTLARTKYRGVRSGLTFFRATQTLKDVVPRSALVLSVLADKSLSIMGNEFDDRQLTARADIFLPTFIKHHQLQFQTTYTGAFASENGNFLYDAFRSRPIGHSSRGGSKQLRLKGVYHFPIAYVEWKPPLLPVYWDFLAGGVFHDWGTDFIDNEANQFRGWFSRYSSGAFLSANFQIFQVFNARIGVAGYYHSGTGKLEYEPIFGINF